MTDPIKILSFVRGVLEQIASLLEETGLEARPIRECLRLPHLNGEGFGPRIIPTCDYGWWWQSDVGSLKVRVVFNNVFPDLGMVAIISVVVHESRGAVGMHLGSDYDPADFVVNRDADWPLAHGLLEELKGLNSNLVFPPLQHAEALRIMFKRFLAQPRLIGQEPETHATP